MSEWIKIGIACFVGAILCGSISLMLGDGLWWIGAFAGFAGGYLSYEFRSLLRAIPTAGRYSAQKISPLPGAFRRFFTEQPRIFEILTFVIYLMSSVALIRHFWTIADMPSVVAVILSILYALILFIGALMLYVALYYIAAYGWSEKTGRLLTAFCPDTSWECLFFFAKGIVRSIPVMARATLFGIRFLFTFLLRDTPLFFFRFGWKLFQLVHSYKRVLCGVDGMIGGIVGYALARDANLEHTAVYLIFGGCIGATWGILNYEIVSKRLLHLDRQTT